MGKIFNREVGKKALIALGLILGNLLMWGSCAKCINYLDEDTKRAQAAREQARLQEIEDCKKAGGRWTWGHFPLGIHNSDLRIEFCDMGKRE